jgi:hypothetical protein
MRGVLAIGLIGCTASETTTSGPGDPSPPSSTGGSTTGTDPVVERVYVGTLALEVADNGILYREGACDAALTLTVDPAADPQVVGSAECTLTGDLAGATIAFTFAADDASVPPLVGEATATYSGAPESVAGTWESTLLVTQDAMILQGSSEGSWVGGADLGFSWTGSFTVVSP